MINVFLFIKKMSTSTVKKSYCGILNGDPKIIAMKLKRPKAPPMQVYNLNQFDKIINRANLTQVNEPKKLSISN